MILLDEKRLQRLKVTYGIALTLIALTMLGSTFLMKYSIDRSRSDSRVINLSGRQRMLSQRLTKCVLTMERAAPGQDKGRIEEIAESLSAWKAAHLGLQRGDEKLELPVPRQSPEVAALFARIEPFFGAMSQALEGLLAQGQETDPESVHAVARVMLDNEPGFLGLMDKITFQFDKEARDRVHAIQRLEWGVLGMGLLVLLLEFLFVFRPSLSELARHSRELQRTNLRLEEETALARDLAFQAEAASRAKGEFLAVMSHELRNPLNGILGFAEILADTPLNREQRSYTEEIRESGTHLLSLVNDVLDLSSIEKGALSIHPAPLAIARLVKTSSEIIRKSAADKGVAFRSDVAAGVPAQITGDERRIRQILINLLSNAVKFTSKGSVALRVTRSGKALDFSVEDTGIGISSEALARLFQPFTQADSSISQRYGGTGIGLAVSQHLAEAMGGSIAVVSAPGKGSTFTFRLPVEFPAGGMASVPPDLSAGADGASPPSPGAETSVRPDGLPVLVVEDDRSNTVIVDKMLQSLGYRVEFAANGAEAVEAFAPGKYLAILMDLRMPVMDGLEAAGIIRSRESGSRVPIIALTANVMPGSRETYLANGMDAVLYKPFKKEELAATLARVQNSSEKTAF